MRREKDYVYNRIFVVGCPRSGTTLLQSLLSAHPRINSFPETHFFPKAYGNHPLKRIFTWPTLNVRGLLKQLVLDIGRPDLLPLVNIRLWEPAFQKPFLRLLDKVTLDLDKDMWVEKTPRNLHYLDEIMQRIPKAKFIHIVRPGEDVVASLFEVTRSYPQHWYGEWSIDKCIKRWNHDILITKKWVGHDRHLIVSYENLIDNPHAAMRRVWGFLNIDSIRNFQKPDASFKQIVRSEEKWKLKAAQPIKRQEKKFDKLFSAEEKKYIIDRLIQFDFA